MINKNQKSKISAEGGLVSSKLVVSRDSLRSNQKSQKEVAAVGASRAVENSVVVKARYLKISAQKLNLVTKIVRGKSLSQAEAILKFSKLKAARLVFKLLASAKAAARDRGLALKEFFVLEISAGQGPSLKRGHPVSRGSWHPIRKKTAHLILKLGNYGTKS